MRYLESLGEVSSIILVLVTNNKVSLVYRRSANPGSFHVDDRKDNNCHLHHYIHDQADDLFVSLSKLSKI